MTATMNRPDPPPLMPILVDNIPPELREQDRWLLWRWEWSDKKGKYDKPPLTVHGTAGSSTNSMTWTTFNTAVTAEGFSGVGFALEDYLGITGIDFDKCRDPITGQIAEPAASIIRKLDTYSEVSPSGRGVRTLLRGNIPEKTRKVNHEVGIEVYDSGRYLTITGHRLPDAPDAINTRQAELEWLLTTFVAKREIPPAKQNGNGHATHGTADDIETARSALAAVGHLADGYWDWLQVGMALHSVSNELLADWEHWSQQSTNYSEGCCREKWRSFKPGGVGIGSLIHWAKEAGWSPPRKTKSTAKGSSGPKAGPSTGEPTSILNVTSRTEMAAAKRFVEQHGDLVRWCDPWEKWLCWDQRRWKIDDACRVDVLAKQTAKTIWRDIIAELADIDKSTATALVSFGKAMSSANGIAHFLSLAKSEVAILPDQLDSHPWLLNCLNGMVDLRTGKLLPHDRSRFLTRLCPHDYLQGAEGECPIWEGVIDCVFESRQVAEFFRRLCGSAMVGEVVEHLLAILWGSGSNGKSLVVETLLEAFGEDYAVRGADDLLLASQGQRHPTEKADLFGRRLVICTESDDGRRLAESVVKSLTGGDTVAARRMKENFWRFRPSHTPFLVTNHMPIVRGTDHGIWRRLLLIPFTRTFWNPDRGETGSPELKADKHLKDKLRPELPGIVRWLVEGCLEWQRDGLGEPEEVKSATSKYRSSMDSLARFVDECCVMGSAHSIRAKEFRAGYEEWCHANGHRPVNGNKTWAELERRGVTKWTNNGTCYGGIALAAS